MGLAQTLQDAATSIMTALDDLPDTVSYHSVEDGGYDLSADQQTQVETVLTLKGLKYKTVEQDADNKRTTLFQTKVLIAGQAFGAIVPKESDYMIIKGVRHEIKQINPAPQNVVFIFIVREV